MISCLWTSGPVWCAVSRLSKANHLDRIKLGKMCFMFSVCSLISFLPSRGARKNPSANWLWTLTLVRLPPCVYSILCLCTRNRINALLKLGAFLNPKGKGPSKWEESLMRRYVAVLCLLEPPFASMYATKHSHICHLVQFGESRMPNLKDQGLWTSCKTM